MTTYDQTMLNLTWYINDDVHQPYDLRRLSLSTVTPTGVYMIYQPAPLLGWPQVIRLGQGVVADRLAKHKSDQAIMDYSRQAPLLVTYAAVSAHFVNGVERYLANVYRPLIGGAFPNVPPVSVNLPLARPPVRSPLAQFRNP